MRNKRKVKLVIELNNVDQSVYFQTFLNNLKAIGNMGGDLCVHIDGAEKSEICLGHDVDIKRVQRIIFDETKYPEANK